ncbi:MAG: hypothetical protein IJP52_03650 [Paludibacteraceae bacterium]|nr:hypothetical protein [Paludibacteraceae bacterium]
MGGRGQFSGKGIPVEQRHWEQVGMIDGIKILKNKDRGNANQPTFSNTPGTKYFIIGRDNKIKQFARYDRKHKIVRSVDVDYEKGHHAHLWRDDATRKSHDKKNIHPLNNWDKHYIKKALDYNRKH